jgi:hypothetical protein
MLHKTYKISKDKPVTVNEPAVAYQTAITQTSFSDKWNPNIPFHGTQEEWWEYFHRIEEGQFYPVSEAHQRVSQWLENQKE